MKKSWMTLLFILFGAIFLVSCTQELDRPETTPAAENSAKSQGKVGEIIQNQPENQQQDIPKEPIPVEPVAPLEENVDEKLEGIAIFYRTSMSSVANRLPVVVEDRVTGDGYTTNIRWESSQNGVVRYIPSADRLDVMGTMTSYSYSEGYLSVHTIDGRVFLFRHRGGSSTISEIDPKTAETTGSIPIGDVNIAIVGNEVYFREEMRKDLFDKRTGGGELMVQSFSGDQPRKVLEYGDSSNEGQFYGAAGSLLSVVYDFPTDTDTIRLHNLNTGKAERIIHENIPTGVYIEGDDAFYQVITENQVYKIYRLSLQGERKLLLEIQLDAQEKGVSVDQEDGKLLLVSYGTSAVKQVLLYDIASGSFEEVAFEPFGSSSSGDYQFVLLD